MLKRECFLIFLFQRKLERLREIPLGVPEGQSGWQGVSDTDIKKSAY